jgi:nucleotide-binding universal stress UspA family protein
MKIILSTDGSEASEQAIRWFSQLPIHGEHVYPIVTVASHQVYGLVTGDVREEFRRIERAQTIQNFERAAKILKGFGLNATHVELAGQPADEITKYAQESAADLVVVGAHGASRLAQIMLGSTSQTVATHSPCSVLIVRSHERPTTSDVIPLHVSIAADGSEDAAETARQVSALGFPFNTTVSLVSVVEHPPLLDSSIQYDKCLTECARLALENLADQLKPAFSNIQTHVLEHEHVGQSLARFAQDHKVDVMVVRDKGRSAISRFFLGSVSRYILHHAACSVLLLRSGNAK